LSPAGILTLTTDFGARDSYVGQMKGAVLAVDPALRVVDLCHEVPSQNIAVGAYLLETGYATFPAGTVHVAVVDPGVGTGRPAVALRAGEHLFVAPDNGLLGRVLDREPLHEARRIENEAFLRPVLSATFEGRDLFAPAAAWLARGTPLERLGPPADRLERLEDVRPALAPGVPARVRVLHADRFGNVAVDADEERLRACLGCRPEPGAEIRLRAGNRDVTRFLRTFGDSGDSGPFLLVNSAGYLEVAIRDGRAADELHLAPGDLVEIVVGREGG
jgi:S-adenosylmethionine hydrolase